MGELTAGVNWLAVSIGTFLSFGLGAMWFSPVMFGVRWAAGVGIENSKDAKQPVAALLLQLIGTFLLAWLVGITAARDGLPLAIMMVLTVSVFLGASGFFDDNGRYAAITEGVFPLAMGVIMVLCHVIL
tara:strand:+ start:203 stop:589 length:387 start_codon:yes stop_codon:yes gene_type:complete